MGAPPGRPTPAGRRPPQRPWPADYIWTNKEFWEAAPAQAAAVGAPPSGPMAARTGRPSRQSLSPDPYGRPSLAQYNSRITQLGTERCAWRPDRPPRDVLGGPAAGPSRRRAWLVRDVFEELLLDGITPSSVTFEEAMWANMRSRRAGDTIYFYDQMVRRGVEPTVSPTAHRARRRGACAAMHLQGPGVGSGRALLCSPAQGAPPAAAARPSACMATPLPATLCLLQQTTPPAARRPTTST